VLDPVIYLPTGDNPLPAGWVEISEVLSVSTTGAARWGFPEGSWVKRSPAFRQIKDRLQKALSTAEPAVRRD
jgi:hypothetical protein